MVPHVIEAEYLSEFNIKVFFDDGCVKIVNLEPYTKRGGIFSSLSDLNYFKKFFVDLNTLCWPNGADIAPERLYEMGKKITGAASEQVGSHVISI